MSKQSHCLKRRLHRWEVGTLPVDIVGVVSNHETPRRLVEWYGLPYHYLPIEPGWKAQQEELLIGLFANLQGRSAYARGVKRIGATAHCVEDLDEARSSSKRTSGGTCRPHRERGAADDARERDRKRRAQWRGSVAHGASSVRVWQSNRCAVIGDCI